MSHDRDREPSPAPSASATASNAARPAPGTRARTDRLPPGKKSRSGDRAASTLDSARRAIQELDQRAGQLADAIAGRDFYSARAIASAIEMLRDRMAPVLADAARGGVDPDELAALEAAAAPLAARLDVLIPQAPAPLPGLGVDLTDPAADAAREAAWLASLPAAARPEEPCGSAAPRAHVGDPFSVARFLVETPAGNPDESGGAVGDEIDPDAASAPPVHASGTQDEFSIGWHDVKRAALSGPFVAAPRKVQDVIYGPLVSLLRKRETIRFVLDPSGGNPVDGAIADVLADLVNDPAFMMGFAEGAVTGTGRAIFDTVKGVHDAAKLAQELIVKVAMFQSRELLTKGKQEIDALIKLIEKAPGILEDFAGKWNAKDSYARGRFQGHAVAYIVTQLAIIVAGSISGGPAMAGPFANVIRVLGWIDNPIAGVAELAADARLSTTAVAALRAGHGMRSVEPIAEARAAGGWFDALDGAAQDVAATRRPLATADELVLARLAAYGEINEIPIVQALKGSAPGIERDTLYVSHADGARLPALLHTIKPDIEIHPWPDGLLVRDGTSEWWIAYNNQAAAARGAERAAAIDAARGSAGLPEPNVATIELVGYRGVRDIHGRPESEWTPAERVYAENMKRVDPLLGAGHVVISFDGGRTFYGLTPEIGDMPLDEVIAKLKAREVFPGKVADDTRHVARAKQMAREQGWNTEPVRVVVMFDRAEQPEIFESVIAAKEATARGEHDLGYAWPFRKPKDGQHYPGGTAPNGQTFDAACVNNCATWPATVGVPVPEASGRMEDYMRELEKWAKARAPIDGHNPPTEETR